MSYIFSNIDVSKTEASFLRVAGQELVFSAAQEFINRINSDMLSAISAFVETTTDKHTQRYKMPGGGHLQKRDENGRFRNVAATGSWDVAFPLEDFGAQFETNDVALAYMTGEELSNHISTIVTQNANTIRYEILRRLFKNTTDSFPDPIHGTLTIQPLANGDAVLYPPAIGSEVEAAQNNYLESNYAASAISNTNDPYLTIVDQLESRFGTPTGGSNIVVFVNNAQTALTRDLAAFVSVASSGVQYGADTSLSGVPSQISSMSSVRVLGTHEENNVTIAEWRYVPAGYMLAVHLDAPAPLKMRVDPASTGLGQGLQLVEDSFKFPHSTMTWRHRFGIGTGNRLNGVVMELGTGGTYTAPAAYAS